MQLTLEPSQQNSTFTAILARKAERSSRPPWASATLLDSSLWAGLAIEREENFASASDSPYSISPGHVLLPSFRPIPRRPEPQHPVAFAFRICIWSLKQDGLPQFLSYSHKIFEKRRLLNGHSRLAHCRVLILLFRSGLSQMSIAGLNNFFQDWKTIAYVYTIGIVSCSVLALIILKEDPIFLFDTGKLR